MNKKLIASMSVIALLAGCTQPASSAGSAPSVPSSNEEESMYTEEFQAFLDALILNSLHP